MTDEVRIPRDPIARRRLFEFAGLTDEERHAIDQWCYDQQREQDRKTGRDGIQVPPRNVEPSEDPASHSAQEKGAGR